MRLRQELQRNTHSHTHTSEETRHFIKTKISSWLILMLMSPLPGLSVSEGRGGGPLYHLIVEIHTWAYHRTAIKSNLWEISSRKSDCTVCPLAIWDQNKLEWRRSNCLRYQLILVQRYRALACLYFISRRLWSHLSPPLSIWWSLSPSQRSLVLQQLSNHQEQQLYLCLGFPGLTQHPLEICRRACASEYCCSRNRGM